MERNVQGVAERCSEAAMHLGIPLKCSTVKRLGSPKDCEHTSVLPTCMMLRQGTQTHTGLLEQARTRPVPTELCAHALAPKISSPWEAVLCGQPPGIPHLQSRKWKLRKTVILPSVRAKVRIQK